MHREIRWENTDFYSDEYSIRAVTQARYKDKLMVLDFNFNLKNLVGLEEAVIISKMGVLGSNGDGVKITYYDGKYYSGMGDDFAAKLVHEVKSTQELLEYIAINGANMCFMHSMAFKNGLDKFVLRTVL